jgi:hypothetical protein
MEKKDVEVITSVLGDFLQRSCDYVAYNTLCTLFEEELGREDGFDAVNWHRLVEIIQ